MCCLAYDVSKVNVHSLILQTWMVGISLSVTAPHQHMHFIIWFLLCLVSGHSFVSCLPERPPCIRGSCQSYDGFCNVRSINGTCRIERVVSHRWLASMKPSSLVACRIELQSALNLIERICWQKWHACLLSSNWIVHTPWSVLICPCKVEKMRWKLAVQTACAA